MNSFDCCKCPLCEKKFLNEDLTYDKQVLSGLLERWYNEQISFGIQKEIAFGVIASFMEKGCKCSCHLK